MHIPKISNIAFKSDETVHRDYIPAPKTRNCKIQDTFHKSHPTVLILNNQNDIIGQYREDKFGHTKGFIISSDDLLKTRELILECDKQQEMEDITKAIFETNLKKRTPLEGVLIEFEQFNKLSTNEECTGLTFYDLKNGKQIFHKNTQDYIIPSEDYLIDDIQVAKINILENKYIEDAEPNRKSFFKRLFGIK